MAKTIDSVVQQGLKALELATEHRDVLEARLGAGAIDGLRGNLTTLGGAVPAQVAARASSKASTVTQAKALETVAHLVTAIRGSVKSHKADAATAKAYGVGNRLDPRVPKQVAAAATGVIDAWNANPDRGRALGLLDSDIATLTAAAASARTADEEQDVKRATAPLATKARNAATKAVEEAVRRISAAGALHFATDKTMRARFEDLLSATTTKKTVKRTPPIG